MGKEYEAACQRMFFYGLEALRQNPEKNLKFVEGFGTRGADEFTKELLNEIADKAPNPSGAMMGAVASHLLFIQENSYDYWIDIVFNDDPSRIVHVDPETGYEIDV